MIVGLTPESLRSWNGGRDFIRLVAQSLKAALGPADRLKIVCPVERDGLGWRIARIVLRLLTGRATAAWIRDELRREARATLPRKLVGARLPLVAPEAAGRHLDVIGPLLSPPDRDMGARWVGYIPDLQHRWLPEMFSEAERESRDQWFSTTLKEAGAVIVPGTEVKNDLERWFGASSREIFPVPVAACPEPQWFRRDSGVLARYKVAAPYFICCNQFWKHKNHRLILEAIALARAQGLFFRFVFTGPTEDHRHPGYFSELEAYIAASNLRGQIHILGMLPKLDQIQLMRRAVAVVQPTLFEGGPGGLSIHDAIALGKRTLVSDIAPNREIEAMVTAYFDPNDPAALVRVLREVSTLPESKENPAALLRAGRRRRKACGVVLRRAFATAAAQAGTRS